MDTVVPLCYCRDDLLCTQESLAHMACTSEQQACTYLHGFN